MCDDTADISDTPSCAPPHKSHSHAISGPRWLVVKSPDPKKTHPIIARAIQPQAGVGLIKFIIIPNWFCDYIICLCVGGGATHQTHHGTDFHSKSVKFSVATADDGHARGGFCCLAAGLFHSVVWCDEYYSDYDYSLPMRGRSKKRRLWRQKNIIRLPILGQSKNLQRHDTMRGIFLGSGGVYASVRLGRAFHHSLWAHKNVIIDRKERPHNGENNITNYLRTPKTIHTQH